jgi:hypothetical protein
MDEESTQVALAEDRDVTNQLADAREYSMRIWKKSAAVEAEIQLSGYVAM